jgi:hypothetical protein
MLVGRAFLLTFPDILIGMIVEEQIEHLTTQLKLAKEGA